MQTLGCFSFHILVGGGVSDIELHQQVPCTFLNLRTCLTEYFYQLRAFTLEKKLDQDGIRIFPVYVIQKKKAIQNSVSCLIFVGMKFIKSVAIISVSSIMHQREAAIVDIFREEIPVA